MLRIYKVPPRYEISLNNRAVNILGFGLLCHAAMNIWVFTNPEIFPSEVLSYTVRDTTYYYFKAANFKDRIFSVNGFPYFILLCAGFGAFYLFAPLLQMIAARLCFKDNSKRRGASIRNRKPYSIEKL